MNDKMSRAKAWCFDNGVSETEIQAAWEAALEAGVKVVKNLDDHGCKWWWLPPHLLQQLIERRGTQEGKE